MSGESVVYDEPANWIVEQARRQGTRVSRRQLADWHRAGLIARPDREYLGGPDGSESIYPRGTLRQAIACSMLMEEFGSVERVGWELWTRGFPVTEQQWREPLREAHQMFQHISCFAADDADFEESGPEQSDAADRFIDTIGGQTEAPHRMGVARRQLGRDGFKEFLGIMISAAIGAFEVSDGSADESADPVHILSRLVGTEPGRHKAAVPSSPFVNVTGRAVAENLETMAQFLPLIPSTFSPDAIIEAELASARDEFTFLLHSFLLVRQNEARIVAGSTPDLALITQFVTRLRPTEHAAALLLWLAVRGIPGWRENLEKLRQGVLAELNKQK